MPEFDSVRYEENGDTTYLGFEVSPWWGENWVARVSRKLGLSVIATSRLLEKGGENGGPMATAQVSRLLNS
jgi:hypothetical protein